MHVVAGDLSGGAARGAYWLHQALRDLGVDSELYTNSKPLLGNNAINSVHITKLDKFLNIVCEQLDSILTIFYPKKSPRIFSTALAGRELNNIIIENNIDILHLHWINSGFINIRHLRKINIPIVWTMRDMWPMTGGCHYSMECKNFMSGCGNCAQLNSKNLFDLSRFVNFRKSKYIPKDVKLVGISRWLSEQAGKSSLFRDYDIRTISNAIDTREFKPVNPEHAREIIGINTEKKIILAGATNVKDYYKGFEKFLELLEHLDSDKYFLCFFGHVDNETLERTGFESRSLGYLNDVVAMRLAYSAADVFVAPSLMEAFGKTLIESMACGTPVVCFDATGPKDIVSHKIDGYKSKAYCSEDLARGVNWVLSHDNYQDLSDKARNKILREFDSHDSANKYIRLYSELIS